MSKQEQIEYTLLLKTQVDDVGAKLGNIKKQLDGLQLPARFSRNFFDIFTELESEIKKFQVKAATALDTKTNFRETEKSGQKILELFRSLAIEGKALSEVKGFKELLPKNQESVIKKAIKLYEEYSTKTQELKKNSEALAIANNKLAKAQKNVQEYQEKGIKTSGLTNLKKEVEKATEAYNKQDAIVTKMTQDLAKAKGIKFEEANLDELIADNKELNEAIKERDRLQKIANETSAAYKDKNNLKTQKGQITKLTNEIQTLIETSKKLEETAPKFEVFRQTLKELGLDVSNLHTVEDFQKIINNFKADGLKEVETALKEVTNCTTEASPELKKFADAMELGQAKMQALTEQQKNIEQFRQRLMYFFSINNTVQLFRRAINSAITTVKELDAAMTEIAVVSDFSIGDMWSQLPVFTKQANELGTTIKDVYEATTLYVQQGLDLQESNRVSAETLKMARIAGLDAADATQYMTAALRGFNMEVNEVSAERVNDVYSELAAITAADTSQLGIAMSKTASIAASANMEFETTAAFLAQIIETTQEAPETAGTAKFL